jgi:hypothetical protein
MSGPTTLANACPELAPRVPIATAILTNRVLCDAKNQGYLAFQEPE